MDILVTHTILIYLVSINISSMYFKFSQKSTMALNLGETSMNMSLLEETVSHLSNQNIDSDEDLDEDGILH